MKNVYFVEAKLKLVSPLLHSSKIKLYTNFLFFFTIITSVEVRVLMKIINKGLVFIC